MHLIGEEGGTEIILRPVWVHVVCVCVYACAFMRVHVCVCVWGGEGLAFRINEDILDKATALLHRG